MVINREDFECFKDLIKKGDITSFYEEKYIKKRNEGKLDHLKVKEYVDMTLNKFLAIEDLPECYKPVILNLRNRTINIVKFIWEYENTLYPEFISIFKDYLENYNHQDLKVSIDNILKENIFSLLIYDESKEKESWIYSSNEIMIGVFFVQIAHALKFLNWFNFEYLTCKQSNIQIVEEMNDFLPKEFILQNNIMEYLNQGSFKGVNKKKVNYMLESAKLVYNYFLFYLSLIEKITTIEQVLQVISTMNSSNVLPLLKEIKKDLLIIKYDIKSTINQILNNKCLNDKEKIFMEMMNRNMERTKVLIEIQKFCNCKNKRRQTNERKLLKKKFICKILK